MEKQVAEVPVFLNSPDALYAITRKLVPVDIDTEAKQVRKYSGTNCSGTVSSTSPYIIGLDGIVSSFSLTNNGPHKINWNNCFMKVQYGFATTTGGTAALGADEASPSWNQVAKAIKRVTLWINDKQVWTTSQYLYAYTSFMLKNYSAQSLQTMDSELFTPVYDDGQMGATIEQYHYPALTALSNVQKQRVQRWVGDATRTTGSYAKIQSKLISFSNFFPLQFPKAIIHGIRSLKVEVEWQPLSNNTMEVATLSSALKTGIFHPTRLEMIIESYEMATSKAVKNVEEKAEQSPEIISFVEPEVIQIAYNGTGGDLNITARKNLQSVMLMRLADGVALNVNGTSTATAGSSGQLLLFSGRTDDTVLTQADITSTANSVPTSIQLKYGNINYPAIPVNLRSGASNASVDLMEPYIEYCKALAIVSDNRNQPLPFRVFNTIMPFLLLRPFSEKLKRSSGNDITISMTGGASCTIIAIVEVLRALVIYSDGSTEFKD